MGYYGVGMTPASGAGGSSSNGSSSNDTKKTNSAPIYSGTGSSGAGSGDDTIWTTEDYNNVGSSNSSGPSNQEVFNSKTMSELDSLMYRWGDPYDGNVTAEEIMRYGVLGAYDKSAEGSPLNDDSSTGSSGGLGLTRRTMEGSDFLFNFNPSEWGQVNNLLKNGEEPLTWKTEVAPNSIAAMAGEDDVVEGFYQDKRRDHTGVAEGDIRKLYVDDNGFVTIGKGTNLMDKVNGVYRLRSDIPDMSKDDREALKRYVKALNDKEVSNADAKETLKAELKHNFDNSKGTTLTEDEVEELLNDRIETNVRLGINSLRGHLRKELQEKLQSEGLSESEAKDKAKEMVTTEDAQEHYDKLPNTARLVFDDLSYNGPYSNITKEFAKAVQDGNIPEILYQGGINSNNGKNEDIRGGLGNRWLKTIDPLLKEVKEIVDKASNGEPLTEEEKKILRDMKSMAEEKSDAIDEYLQKHDAYIKSDGEVQIHEKEIEEIMERFRDVKKDVQKLDEKTLEPETPPTGEGASSEKTGQDTESSEEEDGENKGNSDGIKSGFIDIEIDGSKIAGTDGWVEVEGDNDLEINISEHNIIGITSGGGNDTVYADRDQAVIANGGGGSDTLIGGWRHDWLRGGVGDGDVLKGGAGNDIYYFGRGDGADTVEDSYEREYVYYEKLGWVYQENGERWYDREGEEITDKIANGEGGKANVGVYRGKEYPVESVHKEYDAGNDTISFGGDITAKDLIFHLDEEGNLTIALKEEGKSFDELTDKLIIKGYSGSEVTTKTWWGIESTVFKASDNQKIENLKFSNGMKVDTQKLLDGLGVVAGGEPVDLAATMRSQLEGEGYTKAELEEFDFVWKEHGQSKVVVGTDGKDLIVGEAAEGTVITTGDGEDDIKVSGEGLKIGSGAGADKVRVEGDSNVIATGDGDDDIKVNGDDLVINSGAGADKVSVTGDSNVIDGAGGDNVLNIRGNNNEVKATEGGANIINVTGDKAQVDGGKGDDKINLNSEEDVMRCRVDELFLNSEETQGSRASGHEGNDEIRGGDGADNLRGNSGKDTIYGGGGDDKLSGGGLEDKLYGETGDDLMYGGGGDDVLDGGVGADEMHGGIGNDLFIADGEDTIKGGHGYDTVEIEENEGVSFTWGENIDGVEHFKSGGGDDWIDASSSGSRVKIEGGDGDDTIRGGLGQDIIDGGDGIDTLDMSQISDEDEGVIGDLGWGSNGETLFRGEGLEGDVVRNIENLTGGAGDDKLGGDSGRNVLKGGGGSDALFGRGGDDELWAGSGNDYIDGGEGDDVLVLEGEAEDYEFQWSDAGDNYIKVMKRVYHDSRWVVGESKTVRNVEKVRFEGGEEQGDRDINDLIEQEAGKRLREEEGVEVGGEDFKRNPASAISIAAALGLTVAPLTAENTEAGFFNNYLPDSEGEVLGTDEGGFKGARGEDEGGDSESGVVENGKEATKWADLVDKAAGSDGLAGAVEGNEGGEGTGRSGKGDVASDRVNPENNGAVISEETAVVGETRENGGEEAGEEGERNGLGGKESGEVVLSEKDNLDNNLEIEVGGGGSGEQSQVLGLIDRIALVEDEETAINIELVGDTGQEVYLMVKGLPEGASFNKGENTAEGWRLRREDLEGLGLRSTANGDEDFKLTIETYTGSGSEQNVITHEVSVSLESVADRAELRVRDMEGSEEEWIGLEVESELTDTDGSESLRIEIEGVPEGAVLSAGSYDNNTKVWTLKKEELVGLQVKPAENSGDDFSLTVRGISREGKNGEEAVEEKIIEVKVNAVADTAELRVANAEGSEDYWIGLEVESELTDTDGSESLRVEIEGVPEGAVLSAGSYDNTRKVWTLSKEELVGLQVKPAENSGDDFSLTVRGISREGENGHETVEEKIIEVKVNAVVDTAELEVADAEGNEDEWIGLEVESELVDTDGSESLRVEIAGVPEGAVLSAGSYDSTTKVWTLKKEELVGLKVTPPAHSDEDFTLRVRAITTEGENGDSATTEWKSLSVRVDPVTDAVSLTVNRSEARLESQGENTLMGSDRGESLYGGEGSDTITGGGGDDVIYGDETGENEKAEIDLQISASTADTDGSERVRYIVSGIRGEDYLTYLKSDRGRVSLDLSKEGRLVKDEEGNVIGWELTKEELAGLKLHYEPTHKNEGGEEYEVKWTAIAQDRGVDVTVAEETITVDKYDLTDEPGDDILSGGEGNDLLYGGEGNDTLMGGAGVDILYGGDGHDILTGGAGADLLYGGAGNDTLIIDGDKDMFVDGGAGTDTVRVVGDAGVVIKWGEDVENIEKIISGGGDDTFSNSTNEGMDIKAGGGNDIIIAGAGADTLDGGVGVDTLDYSESTGGVNVNLTTGTVSEGYAEGDTISGFENVIGTDSDDDITGDEKDNYIEVGKGNDEVDGGDGADTVEVMGNRDDYIDPANTDYSIKKNHDNGEITITTPDGVKTLRNVEKVVFRGEDENGHEDVKTVRFDSNNAPIVDSQTLDLSHEDGHQTREAGRLIEDVGENEQALGTTTGYYTFSKEKLLEKSGAKDIDGDTVSVSIKANGVSLEYGEGNKIIAENGKVWQDEHYVYFRPNRNFNTNEAEFGDEVVAGFTFTVSDGKGGELDITTSLDIEAVNDRPYFTSLPTSHKGKVEAVDVERDAITYNFTPAIENSFKIANTETGEYEQNLKDVRVHMVGSEGDEANRRLVNGYTVKKFQVQAIDINGATSDKSEAGTISIYYDEEWRVLSYSPITLDLDGDGLEHVDLINSEVYFDVDGDGEMEHTAWVGADDGLLVYDYDEDGVIDKTDEISFTSYHEDARTDLEGLKLAFDTNGDGVFDKADEEWEKFMVWQDKNQDGVSDEGELVSLEEAGIESIKVDSDGKAREDGDTYVYGESEYTKTDGTTEKVGDVAFKYEKEVKEEEKVIKEKGLGAEDEEVKVVESKEAKKQETENEEESGEVDEWAEWGAAYDKVAAEYSSEEEVAKTKEAGEKLRAHYAAEADRDDEGQKSIEAEVEKYSKEEEGGVAEKREELGWEESFTEAELEEELSLYKEAVRMTHETALTGEWNSSEEVVEVPIPIEVNDEIENWFG